MTGRLLDLDCRRFGKLVATNQTKRDGAVTKRLCHCDCGNETWIPTHRLTRSHTTSCGCWKTEFKRLTPGQAARNEVLDSYKRGAKKRGLVWELSDLQFDHLVLGSCFYCGSFSRTIRKARRQNGDFAYNGIDRLDNTKGYTTLNTVTCCVICNRAKSDMTLEEFMQWIEDLKEASCAQL